MAMSRSQEMMLERYFGFGEVQVESVQRLQLELELELAVDKRRERMLREVFSASAMF